MVLKSFIYFLKYYLYECFACMYDSVLHAWLVPQNPEEIPWDWHFRKVVVLHIGAQNQIQVLWKSISCF